MENRFLSEKEQKAVELLVEAIKFLFYEVGQPLSAWLEQYHQADTPEKIEAIINSEDVLIRMDELTQLVHRDRLLLLYDNIQTSLEILHKKQSSYHTYRRQLSDELLGVRDRVGVELKVSTLEREIEEEGQQLQTFIEQLLGPSKKQPKKQSKNNKPTGNNSNTTTPGETSPFVVAVLPPLIFLVVIAATLLVVAYILQDWFLIITVYLTLLIILFLFLPYAGLQYNSISKQDWFQAYLAVLEKVPGLDSLISRWRNQEL